METTFGHTTIYDWVGNSDLFNDIKNGIPDIEKSGLLSKKNGYECEMSSILGWKDSRDRKKDAVYKDGTNIEIKKSHSSLIFDAIRYAEMFVSGDTSGIHVLIHFSKKEKSYQMIIKHIFIVPNWMMVNLIIPTKEIAEMELSLLTMRKVNKQRLNSQVIMTSSVINDKLKCM